jgi:hypothetical protein
MAKLSVMVKSLVILYFAQVLELADRDIAYKLSVL